MRSGFSSFAWRTASRMNSRPTRGPWCRSASTATVLHANGGGRLGTGTFWRRMRICDASRNPYPTVSADPVTRIRPACPTRRKNFLRSIIPRPFGGGHRLSADAKTWQGQAVLRIDDAPSKKSASLQRRARLRQRRERLAKRPLPALTQPGSPLVTRVWPPGKRRDALNPDVEALRSGARQVASPERYTRHRWRARLRQRRERLAKRPLPALTQPGSPLVSHRAFRPNIADPDLAEPVTR